MTADDDYAEDLRDWYAEDELPADGFAPIPGLPSDHYGEERLVDPPSAPLPVAGLVYDDFKADKALWKLRAWRGGWMIWLTTHWVELGSAQLRSHIYRVLSKTLYEQKTKDDIVVLPWNPGKHKIANVVDALAALAHLPADIDPPAWIHSIHSAEPGDEGPQLISCTNGLFDLKTRERTDHTPAWFNLVSVPFAYDENAPTPTVWFEFLASVWPDDRESIMLLQEYVGYILSGRTDMQKMLLLIGPTRSGKGTIARMLAALIGRGHTVGPTLASLGTNFGLSPLLGRPLAVVSDARLSSTSPTSTIVERLLSITGEDMLTVDRKYREPWSGKLPTRFVILTNELPKFRDSSGAIANRLLILQMTESFLGREDHTLDRRLAAELPGILIWALEGLDRLVRNGRFIVPTASTDAASLMADLASPMSAFVRDRCDRGSSCGVFVDDLYALWRDWADENGHRAGAKSTFGRDLRAVVPGIKISHPRINGIPVSRYEGIAIRPRNNNAQDPQSPSSAQAGGGFGAGGTPHQTPHQDSGAPGDGGYHHHQKTSPTCGDGGDGGESPMYSQQERADGPLDGRLFADESPSTNGERRYCPCGNTLDSLEAKRSGKCKPCRDRLMAGYNS